MQLKVKNSLIQSQLHPKPGCHVTIMTQPVVELSVENGIKIIFIYTNLYSKYIILEYKSL